MVIVIEGDNNKEELEIDLDLIKNEIKSLLKQNKTKSEINILLTDKYKINKKIIYNLFANIDREQK